MNKEFRTFIYIANEFEKVMQYIDLDTGKKYIKTKDGQFIPNDGEDVR